MDPNVLLEGLLLAANAKTPEEQARVAWRFSDFLWATSASNFALARAFNNLLQDKKWPWVNDLWSREEIEAHQQRWATTRAV